MNRSGRITVRAPDGVPEIRPGDDLAALLDEALDLLDGEIGRASCRERVSPRV